MFGLREKFQKRNSRRELERTVSQYHNLIQEADSKGVIGYTGGRSAVAYASVSYKNNEFFITASDLKELTDHRSLSICFYNGCERIPVIRFDNGVHHELKFETTDETLCAQVLEFFENFANITNDKINENIS